MYPDTAYRKLQEIGGTKMKRLVKYLEQISVGLACGLLTFEVSAAEITAIDFAGKPLGQVISTGMVISADG